MYVFLKNFITEETEIKSDVSTGMNHRVTYGEAFSAAHFKTERFVRNEDNTSEVVMVNSRSV